MSADLINCQMRPLQMRNGQTFLLVRLFVRVEDVTLVDNRQLDQLPATLEWVGLGTKRPKRP